MATSLASAQYAPPWADTHMIGIAGSSGSGKTSLAVKIVTSLNLPWVIILSMDSFYRVLSPEQSARARRNEYDFDSPEAIDFDILVRCLEDIKAGRHCEVPIYNFSTHSREAKTTYIYSPHVLILEGIFALHDERVRKMLDMKIFADTDLDTCLARRIARDVKERGRDPEGCLKQWFAYVKPNFETYVEPQKKAADLLVPRGIENEAVVSMVIKHIQRTLRAKSETHQETLKMLDHQAHEHKMDRLFPIELSAEMQKACDVLLDPSVGTQDFIINFDELSALLVGKAVDLLHQMSVNQGEISAVAVLRAGSAMERGLRRVIRNCRTGSILVQRAAGTNEPELHFCKLPDNITEHVGVLVLDPQLSTGGTAVMAVRVMLDHGVKDERIIFVTFSAARAGLQRLSKVYPKLRIVVARTIETFEKRWVHASYFGC